MKVLIAEDDRDTRFLMESTLATWGHEPVTVSDGAAAWDLLQREEAPSLLILDWVMPGLNGIEVCRRARQRAGASPLYIILCTGRTERQATIDGLGAGADDFVTKPFDIDELRARVSVGVRVVKLQSELAARIGDLERALTRVDRLHGILPICSYCKKVSSDRESWQQMEAYVSEHSAVRFSHGVCPDCVKTVLQPQLDEARRERALRENKA